jgi:Tol biopolymer transport system component
MITTFETTNSKLAACLGSLGFALVKNVWGTYVTIKLSPGGKKRITYHFEPATNHSFYGIIEARAVVKIWNNDPEGILGARKDLIVCIQQLRAYTENSSRCSDFCKELSSVIPDKVLLEEVCDHVDKSTKNYAWLRDYTEKVTPLVFIQQGSKTVALPVNASDNLKKKIKQMEKELS